MVLYTQGLSLEQHSVYVSSRKFMMYILPLQLLEDEDFLPPSMGGQGSRGSFPKSGQPGNGCQGLARHCCRLAKQFPATPSQSFMGTQICCAFSAPSRSSSRAMKPGTFGGHFGSIRSGTSAGLLRTGALPTTCMPLLFSHMNLTCGLSLLSEKTMSCFFIPQFHSFKV